MVVWLGVIFVSVGCGSVIDEVELIGVFDDGCIGFVVLDVFE